MKMGWKKERRENMDPKLTLVHINTNKRERGIKKHPNTRPDLGERGWEE